MPKVGVLTGGGDCPGLNPALRAIIRAAHQHGWQVIGFLRGWKGTLNNETRTLGLEGIDDLLIKGGTFIGTSRTNPYKEKDGPALVKKNFAANGLDALIAMGGEDTLGVASKLYKEGLAVVGAPKTIDNDLNVTDVTMGFETALEIVTDAMDRIRTTAESHDRVMVVEIMGRHAGWLAAAGGIAGGADVTLIPEFPMAVKDVVTALESCRKRGKNYAIVAVAEGAKILGDDGKEITVQSAQAVDAFGHVRLGGIGELLAETLKKKTGLDTRHTVLGHIQRGGSPTAIDRILGTIYGLKAMELVLKKDYGKFPVYRNGKIEFAPLEAGVANLKTVPPEVWEVVRSLFG